MSERLRRSSIGWWVRETAKTTPKSPKIAPEAPTDDSGVNRKLAVEPAAAEATYISSRRGQP